jgi:hypothetical protein
MSEKGESMRNAQSQTDGVTQMLQNGSTYEVICDIMHSSRWKVSQIAKAMRDPYYQEGQQIHLPRSNKVPQKSDQRNLPLHRNAITSGRNFD